MKKIYYLFSLFILVIGFAVEANAANVTLKAVPHALPAEGGSVAVSDNGTYTGTSTSSGGIFGIGATWSTISHTFTLTATPNDDYEFKGWSESEEVSTLVTDNPYSVTLSQQGANQARTLTKDFLQSL
ncbi:MAG: hypothetical protein IJ814_06925 [Paludibacteraceae bacterium]|nr:hypothetical protein [Paludibacteraceae bacterium]